MSLTNDIIQQKLTEKFGEQLTEWGQPYGLLTFTVAKGSEPESDDFFV